MDKGSRKLRKRKCTSSDMETPRPSPKKCTVDIVRVDFARKYLRPVPRVKDRGDDGGGQTTDCDDDRTQPQPSLADTPTDPPTSSIPPGPPSDSDPTPQLAPSPMARKLTMSDLPALMTVLGNAAYYTYTLGIQLGLDPHLVRTLKKQTSSELVEFFSLVLETRLKDSTPPLTLHDLHDAIYQPPIGDEDLAWRLQQYFEGVGQPQPLTRTSGVPLSPAMADYSKYLDDVYNNVVIPANPKGGPSPGTTVIKLALVKKQEVSQKDVDERTKATLCGGIDEIRLKKEAIEVKDIFKPEGQEKVKFVLVEGVPGVGKSTLAWELCRRRHKIESMRKFSAVVLLRLRDKEVQEAKSLADLLYHDDPDNETAVAKELRSSQGKNILLILDGFDEVPTSIRKSFYIAKVISGQFLPQATVLVTSRPSARADLTSLRAPDKHVEVLGFTRELIEQYATSIFGPDSPVLADFRQYVSTNPAIKTMMCIPLNCAIVVEVYRENREEGRPIPQTMTQLYSELTLTLMRRHLKERGDNLESLPRRLVDFPQKHPEVHRQLLSFAKLAFKATLKQEVIFEELPFGCSNLGLMTASQQLYISSKGSTNYNFIHLTVQEFLSAYHVSQLPGSEQKQAFQQYSEEQTFSVVWRFVAGLTGFREIGWGLFQWIMGWKLQEIYSVPPLLLHCLYEAQEKVSCESVLGRSKVNCASLSISDSFALGYCIAVSRCTWSVDMFVSSGPEMLEMLVLGLRSQNEVRGSIDSLDLYSIGPEAMACFQKMPDKVLQQLADLHLHNCKLDSRGLDLLAGVVPTMTSLKRLSIIVDPWAPVDGGTYQPTDSGTVKLLQSLANIHLHTLTMDRIPMGREDIMSLSYLIRPPGGLKELTIDDHRMQPDCVELLLKTVLSPSSLQTLDLCCGDGTLISFSSLKDNCNLTLLRIQCRTSVTRGMEDSLFHQSTKCIPTKVPDSSSQQPSTYTPYPWTVSS